MIEHVYRRAIEARGVSRVLVATDDERIAEAVRRFGGEAVMTRATHLTGTDRLAEVASGLECDVVINVQGDEPLVDPALIRQCADLLETDDEAVVATAAHAIHDAQEFANPNVVKVVLDARQRALYFSRAPLPWWRDASERGRPALPDGALRHIGLYAYRAGYLRQFPALAMSPLEKLESLEQLRVLWHGERIVVHIAPHAPPGGVDTAEDLARVRALLAGAND